MPEWEIGGDPIGNREIVSGGREKFKDKLKQNKLLSASPQFRSREREEATSDS
jgi:hypothetical protein